LIPGLTTLLIYMKKTMSKQTGLYIGKLLEDYIDHIVGQIAQGLECSKQNKSHDTYIPEKETACERKDKYQNNHVRVYDLMMITPRHPHMPQPVTQHSCLFSIHRNCTATPHPSQTPPHSSYPSHWLHQGRVVFLQLCTKPLLHCLVLFHGFRWVGTGVKCSELSALGRECARWWGRRNNSISAVGAEAAKYSAKSGQIGPYSTTSSPWDSPRNPYI
jgi:hypothetical protein